MTPAELQRCLWRVVIPTLAWIVLLLVLVWSLLGCEPAPCRVEVTRITVTHEVPADVDGVLRDVLTDLERAGELLDSGLEYQRSLAGDIINLNLGRLQGLLHHSEATPCDTPSPSSP